MYEQGPYEKGTFLRVKKSIEIIVFKEEKTESHTLEPGLRCTISDTGVFPAVSIESSELDAVLVVRLPEGFEWRDYFDIVRYRHLWVVK